MRPQVRQPALNVDLLDKLEVMTDGHIDQQDLDARRASIEALKAYATELAATARSRENRLDDAPDTNY